ncbi:MAG: GNAT family N-acetyltransferase [Alphaproteobacteria bacterium]|nr:GNAT family N-acetyltransferase [Alphaproteobacteria bacterium]
MKGFGGRAIESGSAYFAGDYAGVALWLPPGISPDEEAMLAVLQSAVPLSEQGPVIDLFLQMRFYHPEEPHWYLPILGVAPAFQGTGRGAALMRHALLRVDEEHCAAYLESSSPRNVPLYERHGFEVMGTLQVGSSPPIYPMLRGAR